MNTPLTTALKNFFLLPSWLVYLLIRPFMPDQFPWKDLINLSDWGDGAFRPCYEMSAAVWLLFATVLTVIRRLAM